MKLSLTFGKDLARNGSWLHNVLIKHLATDRDQGFRAVLWGVASGFPLCCVCFYVREWRPFGRREGWRAAWARWPQVQRTGHVQCPACVAEEITSGALAESSF